VKCTPYVTCALFNADWKPDAFLPGTGLFGVSNIFESSQNLGTNNDTYDFPRTLYMELSVHYYGIGCMSEFSDLIRLHKRLMQVFCMLFSCEYGRNLGSTYSIFMNTLGIQTWYLELNYVIPDPV